MTVRFPCRGCGQQLMASSELAGQELSCAICGEVTLVPGTKSAAGAPSVTAPAGFRRERHEVDPRRYRSEIQPGFVILVLLLTGASAMAAGASGKMNEVAWVAFGFQELVIVGLSWSTWMRGGCWWANVLWSWLLTPAAGAIHAWVSTSETAHLADPDRRSYPVLVLLTLLSVVAAVLALILIVVVVMVVLALIAALAGGHMPGAPMPRPH